MILSESRTLDWIIQAGKDNNIHDLTILEKTIRAFCLLEDVLDPNIVASLTGHVEVSRAFARYRNIDEDMKKDLVKLLE